MEVPLIIESTGDYDTLACILFSEAKFNIKEINPIITNNYIKHTIRGTKTDKTDAKALANIGLSNKDEFFTFNKSLKFIEVNKKISLLASLEKQIQSLKRMINSFYEVSNNIGTQVSPAVDSIHISIEELKENIKNLQKEITNESIGEDLDEKVEILKSIKGVSDYMAKAFYVSFAHKDFSSKQSMYAFTGYDPRLRDSGTFQGKAKITKRGCPYIRKKLYQAAFCSLQHCKLFKNIYDRAREKGKHHFICVNIVVKKMIHIMFSLLKNNTVFNPNFGHF